MDEGHGQHAQGGKEKTVEHHVLDAHLVERETAEVEACAPEAAGDEAGAITEKGEAGGDCGGLFHSSLLSHKSGPLRSENLELGARLPPCTVPTGLRMNCWFRQPHPTLKRGANKHCAYGAGNELLRLRRGRRATPPAFIDSFFRQLLILFFGIVVFA